MRQYSGKHGKPSKTRTELLSSFLALRQELSATRIQEKQKPPQIGREEEKDKNYLQIASNSPRRSVAANRCREEMPVQSLLEFGRAIVATYKENYLEDIYFYMNNVGNLWEIRREIIHEIFNKRSDEILNYNSHPSQRDAIRQVIFLKEKAKQIIEGFLKAGITQLHEYYVPMEL